MIGHLPQHKSQPNIIGGHRRTSNAPVPVYGGDKARALEEKIEKSNFMLEQIKATHWQSSFNYVSLPISQFRSVFLEQNPHFKTCINIIEEYNQEVLSLQKDKHYEIRNGPWKQRFNYQLQTLLREILFTRDRTVQRNFSEKVCKWAIDQLEQLEVAAETQHNQTMESMHAKAFLTRPDTAMTAITAASTNALGSRILSAATTSTLGAKRPKSGVLRGLEKNQLPSLSSTNLPQSKRPETAFNQSMRPFSGTYYSKVDLIRPESCKNFRKIRPGSALTFENQFQQSQQQSQQVQQLRPFSSLIRPESAFIKEDDNDDIQSQAKREEGGEVIDEVEEELNRQIMESMRIKEEEHNKRQRDKIRMDQAASSMQPSQQIETLLEDYRTNARTRIADVEPPMQRLVEYERKRLIPEKVLRDRLEEEESKMKPQPAVYENIEWVFPKPEIFLPSQQLAMESLDEEVLVADSTQPEGAPGNLPPTEAINEVALASTTAIAVGASTAAVAAPVVEGKDKKDEVKITPDIRNFTLDKNSKETFVRDLNKKYEQRSTYVHYEPSEDVREMRMEEKWLHARNKEVNDKRADEERISHIKEWSIAKGRLEKEINRKIDSTVYGSQYTKAEYKPRPYTAMQIREVDRNTLPRRPPTGGPTLHGNFFRDIEKDNNRISAAPEELDDDMNFIGGEYADYDHRDLNNDEEEEEEFDEEEDYDYEGEQGDEVNHAGVEGDKEHGDAFSERISEGRGQHQQHEFPRRVDLTNGMKTALKAKPNQTAFVDAQIEDLEYNTSKQKIATIRKLYGATIGVVKAKELEDERPDVKTASLSVYSKDRRLQSHRPFSAVISRVNTEVIRREQIDEIEQIKRALARHNLAVPIKTMKSALLVPEGNLGIDVDLLPEPGAGLFSNPFDVVKKKKKGKGKKKSKK